MLTLITKKNTMKNSLFKYSLSLLLVLCGLTASTAQVSIKEDGTLADSTATLDIQSSDKGFLVPRMTNDNRLAIPSPGEGLFLFQIDSTPGFQYNTDTAGVGIWEQLGLAAQIEIVEARTPLDELDADGDGSLTISEPGSYYLRDTLVVTKNYGDGITIDVDNVTIDLNGYAIIAGTQSTDDGITVRGTHNNIVIKNGTVSGFGGDGIYALNADQSTFKNLLLKDNDGDGLVTGLNCLITHCTATRNGLDGLEVYEGSIIRDCVASFNGDNGIQIDDGCMVYNCTSSNNESDGIYALYGSLVEGCTSNDNTEYGVDLATSGMIMNTTANRNGSHGLDISSSCLVMNNVSNNNGVCITDVTCSTGGGVGSNVSHGAGIRTYANSVIINNQCIGNYFGILMLSSDATLAGNDVQNNSHAGIMGTSSGCLHINNSAHGNGFQQSPTITDLSTYPMGEIVFRSSAFTGGSIGPIIDLSGAGDISTVSDSDHPFANFVY